MHPISRTGSIAVLVATVALTAGCGGSSAKKPDAAEASASAAIAALSSKLAALTSPAATPVAVAATSAAVANPAPTSAVPAAPTTGGLPVVPSGAALSSLLAPPPTSAAAPAATDLAGLKSQVDTALGGALGATDVSKYCNAVPHADIQALVKATVGAAVAFPFQCSWKGTGLKLSVNPNDDDVRGSSSLIGSDGKPIAGVGDTARWDSPVPNMTLPDVYALKGKMFTCFVQGDDVPTSSITYSGKDPFFKITDAAELAYATAEAKLCSDVFAVG